MKQYPRRSPPACPSVAVRPIVPIALGHRATRRAAQPASAAPGRAVRTWLGRKDSNLRIRDSKSRALPLGHAPRDPSMTLVCWSRRRCEPRPRRPHDPGVDCATRRNLGEANRQDSPLTVVQNLEFIRSAVFAASVGDRGASPSTPRSADALSPRAAWAAPRPAQGCG